MTSKMNMLELEETPRRKTKIWLLVAVGVLAIILGVGIGVMIGHFVFNDENESAKEALSDGDPTISDKLMNEMNADKIEEFSRYFTNDPHLAGTSMDLEQAIYIKDKWLQHGLDYADVVPYKVLLSYPKGKENRVELVNEDGTVEFESAREEKILDDSQKRDDIVPPFNAYSAAGVEEGDLVYANYATVDDFFHLERDMAMNLTGKIIIARYGRIFRGDKADNAISVGAIGLILYSDPSDVAPDSFQDQIYPNGTMLPGYGVQRGSLFKHMMDPLTPGYPSTEYAFRIDESEAKLPTIPVHPIGYHDAEQFLAIMDGDEVIADWRGQLKITYKYGPGFISPHQNKKARLNITTTNQLRTTYNVIGGIRGSVDSDRYVLMGNHRDAWVFGSLDATTGGSVIMEVSRAFGKMVKDEGWRPRRSIIFCSWGSEEYGIIGSNEWVEEFSKSLSARAVVYINLDTAMTGSYAISAASSPHLYKAVYEATKKVSDPYPDESRKTVYDSWVARRPQAGGVLPSIGDLGSGSDYAPFMLRIGVSSVHLGYSMDPNEFPGISGYPMYHSVYETFHLLSTYYDPEFKVLLTMSRVVGELTRSFADSLIIPMDVRDYAKRIEDMFDSFKGTYGDDFDEEDIDLGDLENAINNLREGSNFFHETIVDLEGSSDPTAYRIVNDQLTGFERTFIDPLGLPGRSIVRHTIFAPSSKNLYASAGFPGLTDVLFDIESVTDPDERMSRWREVRRELATVTHMIQAAASYLDHMITSLYRG